MSDYSNGVFEVLAADESEARLASRKALVLSESRISDRLGGFLASSKSPAEYDARFSYVEDEVKGIIAVSCEEVGHGKPDAIFASLRAHYRPAEPRTASVVHEARRPKMCPYHSEVVDISLGSNDPKAGYEVMQSHAWGSNHCQGDWEGKCGFKREMVTQSFWDDRQKALDEQREQRQGDPALPANPVPEGVDTPEATEPIGDTVPEDTNVVEFDSPEGPIDNGGSPVDAGEPLAMAASAKEGESRTADAAPSQESFPCQNCGTTVKNFQGQGSGQCPNCGAEHLTNGQRASKDYNPSDQDDKSDKEVPCPECGGDGKTNGGKTCPRCKGHGRVQDWGPSTLDALESSAHEQIVSGDKKWIQKAVKRPGQLHRDLGVPQGEKIPEEKIEEAEKSSDPKEKERAQFAENVKKLKKGSVEHTAEGKGNTGLDGPEPKMDKRLWTPQNVRKVEVPSERHPTKEKDPIEPIKAVNDDDLVEIGEKTTERVELPTAGENLDDSGFAGKNQEQAPGTKTWTGTEGQADPVTNKSLEARVAAEESNSGSWPTTDEGWHGLFKQLDSEFDTPSNSPLHHDKRCPLCNPDQPGGSVSSHVLDKLATADDVERNPVRDLLTEGYDGFVAPQVIARVKGK